METTIHSYTFESMLSIDKFTGKCHQFAFRVLDAGTVYEIRMVKQHPPFTEPSWEIQMYTDDEIQDLKAFGDFGEPIPLEEGLGIYLMGRYSV